MAETPTTEPEKKAPAHKTLAVAWPVVNHTHEEHVITQEGTQVPASHVKAIVDDAASVGVRVYEIKEV